MYIPAKPPPIGVDRPHNETRPSSIFKSLSQHFRASVCAGDVKTGFQKADGMKSGAGSHVQDPFDPPLLENPNEKIPFTTGACIPINEIIPFSYKALNILLLVEIGFPLSDGIIAIMLTLTHTCLPLDRPKNFVGPEKTKGLPTLV